MYDKLKPVFILLTGLSGSGKTTLGTRLASYYKDLGKKVVHLDGDDIRSTYHHKLGFSKADRGVQLMRTGELALPYLQKGNRVIASLIAPYDRDRENIKKVIEKKGFPFVLIHIDCPIHVCIERDPKGLYKKVKNGGIKNFTGIDAPYERPKYQDLIVTTHLLNEEACLLKIIRNLHMDSY